MLAVTLREEIRSAKNESQLIRNINPIISWENFKLSEGLDKPAELGGLEGDPEWFFSHTYPTSVIKDILQDFKGKINGTVPGIFPLDGYLGSGKSHVLLTLYHIFHNFKRASNWFQEWKIDFPEIRDAIVIPIPLQHVSCKYLWEPIFKTLGKDIDVEEDDWPKEKQIKKALGNKTVIILIDEIDNWYDAKNSREKARTRGFLQSLSEVSEDPDYQLNLVITFLGITPDVKVLRDVVARPRGGSSIVMQRTDDIFDVVRFRLFENIDKKKVDAIVLKYIKKVEETLKKKGLNANSYLYDELKRAYPYHPSFLKTLNSLKVRQMLIVLARIVIRKIDEVDIIISSDLDDDILREYLHSLNPKIVDAYFSDINFLKSAKEVKDGVISYKLARAILFTSLLNSLETKKGADIKEIIFGCDNKFTIQDIDESIKFLERWTRLKKIDRDGLTRYVITIELPVAAKIERKVKHINNEDAIKIINRLVENIVSSEIKGFKLIYNPSDITNDKRFKVLTLLKKPTDIFSIYPSRITNKNTLYILYPSYSLESDETKTLAKRIIAAENLAETEEQTEKFKEFYREYKNYLRKQIDNAGWIGTRGSRKNLRDKPTPVEKTLTNLRDVKSIINEYASIDLLKYFLNLILDEQNEITLGDLKERFYRLEGAPILLKEKELLILLAEMVKEGDIAIQKKQGKTLYKQKISYESIENDDLIKKPPKKVIPPTKGEIIAIIKEKKKLSFNKFAEKYPFIENEVLKKLYQSIVNPKDDIYIVEKNVILAKPINVESSILLIKEEAAKILEQLVLKIVNESTAIKVTKIMTTLKNIYKNSGLTESVLSITADNLEIDGKIVILRKKDGNILQMPEERTIEEIMKKMFLKVKKEGEIKKEMLIESLITEIPIELKSIEDGIALLIDDEKLEYNKDTTKLSLFKISIDTLKIPKKKKIMIRGEGNMSEVIKIIENELEDTDIVENVKIEIKNDLNIVNLKELFEKFGEMNIKFSSRRKEI